MCSWAESFLKTNSPNTYISTSLTKMQYTTQHLHLLSDSCPCEHIQQTSSDQPETVEWGQSGLTAMESHLSFIECESGHTKSHLRYIVQNLTEENHGPTTHHPSLTELRTPRNSPFNLYLVHEYSRLSATD